MDAGCYAIHSMRLFDPDRPEVTAARARCVVQAWIGP